MGFTVLQRGDHRSFCAEGMDPIMWTPVCRAFSYSLSAIGSVGLFGTTTKELHLDFAGRTRKREGGGEGEVNVEAVICTVWMVNV